MFTPTMPRIETGDMGLFQRQRARFVKDDGVNLFDQLQRSTIFNQNALVGGLGQKV